MQDVTLNGFADDTLNNADSVTAQNLVTKTHVRSNHFLCVYINGKSDPTEINNPKASTWKYGDKSIEIHIDRPLGYFNDDGQWIDMNPQMKLTDVFPDTHLAAGRDAAIKKGGYWFVQAADHRKNFGNDSCKFDINTISAFTPNSWGAFNWKYQIDNPGTLSSDGPLESLASSKKASK